VRSLVGLLASRHVQPAVVPLPGATGRLGALQQKRLMDLIHQHLASDLSLTRMAVTLTPPCDRFTSHSCR
jgi:hypothetical protein